MELRIAIPSDFSKPAAQAARFALDLFREVDCVFFLVHTYTPSFFRAEYLLHSPGQIGLGDFYKQRVLDLLERQQTELERYANPARHRFRTHAAFNTLDAELNEMAEKEHLDLIAMGTQGATGAKEILLGTHAVMVAHKSRIPVLIIPQDARAADVKQVLFPTDYGADYDRLPWTVLKTLLKHSGAHLHVLHTYDEADLAEERVQGKEQLQALIAGQSCTWHELPETGLVPAINNFARQTPLQLLVLVRNPHSFLENLLVTPVIDQIGFHTRIPLLVLPPA